MGSSSENGLRFTALRNQPRPNECWMRVVAEDDEEYTELFYIKYVKRGWHNQSKYQNKMAERIQKFFRYVVNNNKHLRCLTCRVKISERNTCYFCEQNYCRTCQPDHIVYNDCEVCGLNWCKREYRYCDDYCPENKRSGGGCWNCGN